MIQVVYIANYLTNSMEQSHSWETNGPSATQEILLILWNPRFITTFKRACHLSLSRARSIHSMLSPAHFPNIQVQRFCIWFVTWLRMCTQAGGPHLVGCPRLLVRYIRGYAPYLKTVSPFVIWGRAIPWWQTPTCHGDDTYTINTSWKI